MQKPFGRQIIWSCWMKKMSPGFSWHAQPLKLVMFFSVYCFRFLELYVQKKISEPGSKVVLQKCQVSASPACIYSFPDRQKTANTVVEGKLLLPAALFVSSFQNGPCLFRHTGLVPGYHYLEKPNSDNPPLSCGTTQTFRTSGWSQLRRKRVR